MKKLALIILDGWGIGIENDSNAIYTAKTPFMDKLWDNYPHTQLQASHEYVGLPHGQLGGSEVGHLTIGAGQVFFQELPRISKSLSEPENKEYGILHNETFKNFLATAKKKPAHLIGMVSPGGIHSHYEHLFHVLELMKAKGCLSPYIHFISDGRDTLPQAGIEYAQLLLDKLDTLKFGKVVDVTGRFYAMDRDRNWDRTQKATDVIGYGKGIKDKNDLLQAFTDNYKEGLSDELQEATKVDHAYAGILQEEPFFFFNFRGDRMKQIVTKIHELFPPNDLFTMARYDKDYPYPYLFGREKIEITLGKIISEQGVKQLRAAETDKIAHVTYFFNGGTEVVYPGEIRKFAESTKVTYDKTPEMRAKEIVDSVIQTIDQETNIGFALINFANADLVGHFGVFESVVKACETVDTQLSRLCKYLTEHDYLCVITSDHGNADEMKDIKTGHTKTSHTLNPVPFIIYSPKNPELKKLKLNQHNDNGLSKVAGTVLELMEIEKPKEHFESLIEK